MSAGPAPTDTIVAIASAPGAAGVGIVRVSGPMVAAIASQLLGRTPTPRYAHVAAFRDAQANIIDRGVLLHFVGPASYTGEDVLELQGHGSPVVLDTLLRRVCTLGARLARPGEFTERAFLNGKLDLAQAEAVADLIAARSQSAARAALQSMEGVFSRKVGDVLKALIELRVHIEAAIDFPEEEIDFLADPALLRRTEQVRTQLAQLLREAQRGLRLNDGLRVAIIGRPNAGKSSLLNALAGSDRAIVTPIAGTTRDVLRESINLDGIVLELADTAGMRDTHDVVEREGVLRAQRELERTDAVLLVTDAQHASVDLGLLTTLPASVRRLVLINKIDLENDTTRENIDQHASWLCASAKTGEGLDRLREQLKEWAGAGDLEGAFTARRRHVVALEHVTAHVDRASLLLKETRQGELAAEELRQAQHMLGEITGDYTSDDLLGAIFSSFCIGK